MRWKTPVFLLLLALGAWYFYYWQQQQLQRPFHVVLVDIDSSAVDWFSLQFPQDEVEWVFKREGGIWIMSNGAMAMRAVRGAVDSLLVVSTYFESDSIVQRPGEEGEVFDEEDAYRFRFYTADGLLDAYFLWPSKSGDVNDHAYLRPKGQGEVFWVDKEGLGDVCWRGIDSYRSRAILPFPGKSLLYVALADTSGLVWQAFWRDSLWEDGNGGVLELPALMRLKVSEEPGYFRHFGVPFEGERQWSVLLSSTYPEMPDTYPDSLTDLPEGYVQIDVFVDSASYQPFVFQSSIHPGQYFVEDSSETWLRGLLWK